MPLDADVTISKNLTWFTRIKEIMLEAEAYDFMMALPTDDWLFKNYGQEGEKAEGTEERA